MDELTKLRNEIDELDQIIMEKLNTRFCIIEKIASYKRLHQLPIDDKKREMIILSKTINYPFSYSLSNVYQQIIHESKLLQTKQTFLIGKSLPYSYSKEIHHELGNPYYSLYETNDFESFIKNNYFYGLNITNPFKTLALNYAHTTSDIVKATGVANLLVRRHDLIHAENVDYDAFIEMLGLYNIQVQNMKAIIVGNGATSKTVALALHHLGIKRIVKLVRTIRSENEYLLENYRQFKDFDIIINTTSYGVKPYYVDKFLFSLAHFTDLKAVIDVNYNPYRTPLVQEALRHKDSYKNEVKILSGLSMLVAGAKKSEVIWMTKDESTFKSTKDLTKHFLEEKLNLVLIGMPYSGKTTIGKKIALIFKRPFIDTDEILRNRQQSIEHFRHQSNFINAFREAEANVIKEIISNEGYVIATGGGAVEREENLTYLSQSGIIIYLNIPLETLYKRFDDTRLLIDSKETLNTYYQKRHPLYLKYADIIINDESIIIEELMVKVHEYFNNQWS